MKKDIHPEDYRLVVFKDMSNEYMFLCPSCAITKETIQWEDGNEYPLFKLDISHKSHPFFTVLHSSWILQDVLTNSKTVTDVTLNNRSTLYTLKPSFVMAFFVP